MGEIGNALKLLTILQCKGVAKSDYLADRLEVSKRQIYRYIQQLEESGININSKRGRYGGYTIDKNQFINYNTVQPNEIELLELAYKNLKSTNFPHTKDIEDIIDKLKSVCIKNIADEQNLREAVDYYFVKENHKTINDNYIKELFDNIRSCISSKEKMKILYDSNSSEKIYRKIHPYAIFSNRGDLYLVAFCEKRNSLRNFKINRIIEYEILDDERYKIKEDFNIKKYADESFGVFKDESLKFKLKIRHPFSTIIKERETIKDEKVKEIDDDTIIYEAEAKGKTEIISWIISMKTHCEVIEPERLKKEVKDILEDMVEIYE